MNPDEAQARIDATPHSPSGFGLPVLKSAWKEIAAVSGFVAVVGSGLVGVEVITPDTRGVLILSAVLFAGVGVLGYLAQRRLRKHYQQPKPTIHLDRDTVDHTIDQHLKHFIPDGDILILQTWIPENVGDTDGVQGKGRIGQWQRYLQDAIIKHRDKAQGEIRFRVLLLGSERVLRNRVRYRWDLAQQAGGPYPLSGENLDLAVSQAKDRIDRTHSSLISMEKLVNDYVLGESVNFRLHVSIRYYGIAPCGPLYIFGNRSLLTGFYDFRWTSDRAPLVRIDKARTAEWEHFRTQFECIWDLRDNSEGINATRVSDDLVYTSRTPSWRSDGGGPV